MSRRRGFAADAGERSDLPWRDQVGQLAGLFRLVKPNTGWLVAGILGVGIASSLGLVFPLVMGRLVDVAIGEEGTIEGLNRIALLLLAVFFVQAVFSYVRVYALGVVGAARVPS